MPYISFFSMRALWKKIYYYIHISFSQIESLQLPFNFVNSLSLDHWWVRCLSPFTEAPHVWPPLLPTSSCRTLAAMQSACHRGRWVSPLWYPEWEPYRVPIPGLVWRSDPSSGSLDSHQYLSDHQYLDGIMRHRDYHKRKSYLQHLHSVCMSALCIRYIRYFD